MTNEPHFQPANGKLIIKSHNSFVFLDPSEILYIEANGHVTYFHSSRDTYETRSSLGHVADLLSQHNFLRISRFHIVNLNRVKTVEHWFRGQYRFTMDNSETLTATRGYRDRIRAVLERTQASK